METNQQEFFETSEAEMQKLVDSWKPGQDWEYRNQWTQGQWRPHPSGKPGWFFDSQYRLKAQEATQ